MLTTTLNRIRTSGPCPAGWGTLLRGLGKTGADDEPLPYGTILRINGLDDALWCCRAEPQYEKEWRLFTVWCARQVEHLLTDARIINAIDIAERFAHGEATEEELGVASEAIRDIYRDAAGMAARDAAWAAAQTTVRGAAGGVIAEASWEAVRAASHAECNGALRAVAGEAAKAAQSIEFLRIVD